VEAGGTGSGEIGLELDRIEARVEAGERDLKGLGFWKVVAAVKRDRGLVLKYADQIGRIDTAAFRNAVLLRVPVWLGNAVLVGGGLVGLAALIVASVLDDPTIVGILVVGTGLVWTVSFHSPVHWLVGWLAGIRFMDYFLATGFPPWPGLKTDYATYLRAEPSMRAWMHASGALGTKLAPFLALAFSPWDLVPMWAVITLVAVGIVSIGTDLVFSVKSSDWKRYLRERRVSRLAG
jgi:hypothetical protein